MGKGSRLRARAANVKPRTETVHVCTDGEIVGALGLLDEELRRAERDDALSNKPDQAPKIARQIEELEGKAREATVALVLRGIGTAWSDLLAEHPPTKEQLKKKPGLDHNPETFPYAAVAASLVSVDGEPEEATIEDVHAFFDPLPNGEWGKVWGTCLAVNVGDNSVPFNARASVLLHGSERSSASAESGESPDPTG